MAMEKMRKGKRKFEKKKEEIQTMQRRDGCFRRG